MLNLRNCTKSPGSFAIRACKLRLDQMCLQWGEKFGRPDYILVNMDTLEWAGQIRLSCSPLHCPWTLVEARYIAHGEYESNQLSIKYNSTVETRKINLYTCTIYTTSCLAVNTYMCEYSVFLFCFHFSACIFM